MPSDQPIRDATSPPPIFGDLDPAEWDRLRERSADIAIARGDVLVRQGDPADALFVVISGRFAVEVEGRDGALSEIGAGQPIGEIAFLAGGERTATVRALRDSIVMRLGRAEFDQLALTRPQIWRALSTTLARRLAALTAGIVPPPNARPRTIAIIQAGSGPPALEFPHRLYAVLKRTARTALFDAQAMEPLLGGPYGNVRDDATAALNALEGDHDLVLLDALSGEPVWSEKVIRHADMVLAVGNFGADPRQNAIERVAERYVPRPGRRLVLLHEHHRPIAGTSRWLEGRNVALHHHVALDRDEGFDRLARFILGTARGLIACGGGALCAAHVGVFKALSEAGFEFDIMGGTSGGSAMTAAFALGTAPEDIDQGIHDIFVRGAAMRRYTWPRYSLLDHTHFDRQLARHYGGRAIEDMWIPWFAVSTDLSRQDIYRHDRGDLWTAVRASSSIPVLLPPLYTPDGHMLVDGCLLDNVPIRVMRDIKRGPNVVVSFDVPHLERFDVDYEALPSRRELVAQLVTPFGARTMPDAPGLATVLMRSLMAGRHDFQRHMQPEDMLLVPPLPEGVGLLDWDRHTEVMDHAFAWCRRELAAEGAGAHRRWTARG